MFRIGKHGGPKKIGFPNSALRLIYPDCKNKHWRAAKVWMRNRLALKTTPRLHDGAVRVAALWVAFFDLDAIKGSASQALLPKRRTQPVFMRFRAIGNLIEVFSLEIEMERLHGEPIFVHLAT